MAENYRRWRLPQLWDMVAGENADAASVHLMNLRRQQTALEAQRDRLRRLRDDLIAGWPPEKSEAAAVFVRQIDDLIRALDDTACGAGDLRMRVSQVVGVLHEARSELAPLLAQYQRAAELVDQRVGRHAQKLLDEKARGIFVAVDKTLSPMLSSLRIELPVYKAFTAAGVIEPSTSSVASTGTAGATMGRNSRTLASLHFDPPLPAEVADSGHLDEFGLASSGSVDNGGAQSIMPSAVGSGPSGPRVGGAVSPPVIGVRMPTSVGQGNSVRVADVGESVARGGTVAGHPISSVMPPRVAAMPASGTARGGNPALTARPGLVGGPTMHPAGLSSGYRDRSYEEYAARRRVPAPQGEDDGWFVPEGVPPVLEAPPDRPHEPGPGVLGLDR